MTYDELLFQVRELRNRVAKLYIYGVGIYGKNIYNAINNEITIDGFCVTKRDSLDFFSGKRIYELGELCDGDSGFILGLNSINTDIVMKILEDKKINESNIIQAHFYLDSKEVKARCDSRPLVEITTRIGCSINCKYCPQSLLVGEYFKIERDVEMSLKTFSECLKKFPNDTRVRFCGMAEPFLNSKCINMIQLACENGFEVELFTTLVGADKSTLAKISKLNIQWVNLHVADKRNNAKIPKTEKYYELLEYVVALKKVNGEPFIDVVSSQMEADERVLDILGEKYPIMSELQDRAGNLDLGGKRKKGSGKFYCSVCGTGLNHNVLLPDGTMMVCCQDYGMRHILGNLLETSFEELKNGKEINKIRECMAGKSNAYVICRECEYANFY